MKIETKNAQIEKFLFQLKLVVSRYLSPSDADIFTPLELKKILVASFQELGYSKLQITDYFLKQVLNGEQDDKIIRRKKEKRVELNKKKILLKSYEKYLNRNKGIESFRKAFDEYYDSAIDIYNIDNEEALRIVKRLKERKNRRKCKS